jgi:hypothetical protein
MVEAMIMVLCQQHITHSQERTAKTRGGIPKIVTKKLPPKKVPKKLERKFGKAFFNDHHRC